MESFSKTQLTVLGVEGLLVIAGIALWTILSKRTERKAPVWSAPLPDTLFLAWGVVFGAFAGQLAGVSLIKAFPEGLRASEAVRILVIGACFHGGCLAAWLMVHGFLRGKGRALPPINRRPSPAGIAAGSGLAAFLRVLPVVLAVGFLWGVLLRRLGLPVEQQDLVGVFARTDSPVELVALLVLAIVVAPLNEELIFRAGIFRMLEGRIGRWAAIAVSSALFALLHASWIGFAPLFCLGIVFCLAYERSGNIAVPVIAHGLFNLNSIVLILVMPAEFLQ